VPPDAARPFLEDARAVGVFLAALATAGGAAYTLARGVRRSLRAVILWACAEDVIVRDTQHRELVAQITALHTSSRAAEARLADALERVVGTLDDVVGEVKHITQTLVETALRRP
jgi:hypothetical protein